MPKLDKKMNVRVTEEEHAHLHKAAADAGIKPSEYVRAVLLGRTVAFVGQTGITVVHAANSSASDDDQVTAMLTEALQIVKTRQGAAQAESDVIAAVTPPEQPPAPTSTPDEGGGMVGEPQPQEPPVGDTRATAGAIPGPVSKIAPTAGAQPADGELGVAGECGECGGRDGQHQAFCPQITGESPVREVAERGPLTDAAAPTVPAETVEMFLTRRTGELVAEGQNDAAARLVAEAEWRQIASGHAPATAPPDGPVACSNCGTMKLNAAIMCPDCGQRPD